jgi:hypothetical protein
MGVGERQLATAYQAMKLILKTILLRRAEAWIVDGAQFGMAAASVVGSPQEIAPSRRPRIRMSGIVASGSCLR